MKPLPSAAAALLRRGPAQLQQSQEHGSVMPETGPGHRADLLFGKAQIRRPQILPRHAPVPGVHRVKSRAHAPPHRLEHPPGQMA